MAIAKPFFRCTVNFLEKTLGTLPAAGVEKVLKRLEGRPLCSGRDFGEVLDLARTVQGPKPEDSSGFGEGVGV